MIENILKAIAAVGGFALLWKAFMKWGAPAFGSILKDKVSPKVARFLYRSAPHWVDIVEIAGDEFDWKGEDKCREVLARLAEEIGRQLKPAEKVVAKRAIGKAVYQRNKGAGSSASGLSFADFLKKPRR